MKKVLVFAGTTEGRDLAKLLADAGISVSVCVATDYAKELLDDDRLDVHCGRLVEEEMETLIKNGHYDAIVDATHPYAQIVSQNIRRAAGSQKVSLFRLRRDIKSAEDGFLTFKTHESCSSWLCEQTGKVFLTTGSKDLGVYTTDESLKKRLYVRVLPSEESIHLCKENGLVGRQILAMQGPFSEQINACILKEYDISWMVTKISGHAGGFDEKIEAAKKAGVGICAILPPEEKLDSKSESVSNSEYFLFETIYETIQKLESLLQVEILSKQIRDITLVGIGMGSMEGITREGYQAFEQAQVIFGAKRMIESLPGKAEKVPYYRADEIISYLIAHPEYTKIAAAFSGDSGFYSGAQSMKKALDEAMQKKILQSKVTILPGISSISALSAKLGVSWNDAVIESIHGRTRNIVRLVRENKKVILLLSGKQDLIDLCDKLIAAGLSKTTIYAGYRLSYPDEAIFTLHLDDLKPSSENDSSPDTSDNILAQTLYNLPEGLYTCLIENKKTKSPILTPGMDDAVFSRTKVPMTKNEVRVLSISRLNLTKDSIVYDVGSGTGSVSVECARLSPDIHVYAIEQKEEAVNLTKENIKMLGLSDQVTVIRKKAPDGFEALPAPSHVFIGGSSGALSEILTALQNKIEGTWNTIRVVINAVSLETIAQLTELTKAYPIEQLELTQLQASRAHVLGSYHLMQAQNPVLIASFDLLATQTKDE